MSDPVKDTTPSPEKSGPDKGAGEKARHPTTVDTDGSAGTLPISESVVNAASSSSMLSTLLTLPGYVVEKKLGQGGMGAVFRAQQTALGRTVAIKVLPEHACNNPKFVARLSREARVLAKISHSNVVGCIDMGEHQGLRYVVMEYVEGETLGSLIEKRKHLPLNEALHYLKQAVLGLDCANALGIIHRDIKPDNMLLAKQTNVGTTVRMQAGYQLKIADLGLATFSGESTENTRLTSEGAAIGSPHYMSPEQTLGQSDLDFRTDVYALGITLYHALTGVTPYMAPSVAAVLARKLSEPMADPREMRPELPPAAALLLQKMTAREKSDRYSSYGALLEDIEALEHQQPLKAELLHPPRASIALRDDTINALRSRGQRSALRPTVAGAPTHEQQGSGMGMLVGVIAAIAIAGAAAYFLLQPKPRYQFDDSGLQPNAPAKLDSISTLINERAKSDLPAESPKTVAKFAEQSLIQIENDVVKGWATSESGGMGPTGDGGIFLQTLGKDWLVAERTLPSNEFLLRATMQVPRGADNFEMRVGVTAKDYIAYGMRFPKDAQKITVYIERRAAGTDAVLESLFTRGDLNPDEGQNLRIQFWSGFATCFLADKLAASVEADAAGAASNKLVLAVKGGMGQFRTLELRPRTDTK